MSSSEIDYLAIFRVVDDAKKAWRDAESAVYATEQAEKIFRDILPAVLERFVRKNADYGDAAKFLGIKGQFADINPKFWKLKRALWDEEPLIGESAEEILSDLIGHCLLTLYFIETQRAAMDKAKALMARNKESREYHQRSAADLLNPFEEQG